MLRAGLFDREVIHKNGTFVAINLGHNAVSEHECSIERFAMDFTRMQANAEKYDKRKTGSLWVNTDAYKQGLIIPRYTQCKLGLVKVVEEQKRTFNLLREGYYYVLCIGWHGDIIGENVLWQQYLNSINGKTEDKILDAESYNRGILAQINMGKERKEMRDIPFVGMWGASSSHSIYLFVNSDRWSVSERFVKSIKHCVEQGDMMFEPNVQKVFPNAAGGLTLVNLRQLDYLMKANNQ